MLRTQAIMHRFAGRFKGALGRHLDSMFFPAFDRRGLSLALPRLYRLSR
jgi:hypothetical protein